MDKRLIFCAGSTRASRFAATYLMEKGFSITTQPSPEASCLLLDVPSFGPEGQLRGGGTVEALLPRLAPDVVIFGGNLDHPALKNYRTADLLRDSSYLAENAYITAECALDVALPYLLVTLRRCPTLVIGWGRIGKCLGQLLKAIGAEVTIAARKETDRAMLRALGFRALDPQALAGDLRHYRLIFNTAPAMVLNAEKAAFCHPDCVKIELASAPGIEDDDVILARGLPGVHMPESSGKLIAETFARLYEKEEIL